MLTTLDEIAALLAMLAGMVAVIRYWQLVEHDCRDDTLPDPVLIALLRQQPGIAATASNPPTTFQE